MKSSVKALLTLILLLLGVLVWQGCAARLPEIQVPEASKVYDRSGEVLTSVFQADNRQEVLLEKVSPHFKKALLAVEDARFYEHGGLDPVGLFRALFSNIKAGGVVQGGSTITQQTVKLLFLTPEKTLRRKIKEAWLAFLLERKYTKDEILELYMNNIYFGEGAYGVETASQTYFGLSSSQLDLAQAALLAGIPKSPNRLSPLSNPDAAIERQHVVLGRMVDTGYISAAEAEKAKGKKLKFRSSPRSVKKVPYVVDEVTRFVTSHFDDGPEMLLQGGLRIYTSIDRKMQDAAEQAVAGGLGQRPAGLEAALVALDPTNGHIRAMVGGRDYARSKFNRATQARRQPGSAFKPFLYAAALERGYTAASMLTCEPASYPQPGAEDYTPTDYGDAPYHYRPFTLYEALAISDNVVSVRLNQQVGPGNLAAMARGMGIKSKLRPYLSLALGTSEVTPLEMAAGFIPLASRGLAREPVLITKITDRSGTVLYRDRSKPKAALSEEAAYIVTDMLKAVLRPGGTASQAGAMLNRPAAGKTGTTQNYRDAWFVGYTPALVAAVFIGYDQPTKAVGLSGGAIAAPLWANFINGALAGAPGDDFPLPDNVVRAPVNLFTGKRGWPDSPDTRYMAFVRGTEPAEESLLPGEPTPDDEGWDWNRGRGRRKYRTPGDADWFRFFWGR